MMPSSIRFHPSRAILSFPALVLCSAGAACASSAEAFDARQVRLLPGSPFHDRPELHCTGYLAAFEVDRLLFHYRALAGLPQPSGALTGYKGWDSELLRGHLVGH